MFLWINDPCLVCGRYQNLFQEVNLPEASRVKIPVLRRNTGGGTVYHDRGNLNYTLIRRREPDSALDYDSFLEPVIHALVSVGVPAKKRNTCDIAIGDRKISGSAQSVKRDRILHHGTLLFDADLTELHRLLRPVPGKIESKAVKSVPSPVTNIREHLTGKEFSTVEMFTVAFRKALMGENGIELSLPPEAIVEIERLSREKYRSWDWTFAKGPAFTFFPENTDLRLCVEKGIVVQCNRGEFVGLPADTVIKELTVI